MFHPQSLLDSLANTRKFTNVIDGEASMHRLLAQNTYNTLFWYPTIRQAPQCQGQTQR